jgi:hypothetical protein
MKPVSRRIIDIVGHKITVDFSDFLRVWDKIEKKYLKDKKKKSGRK